MVVQKQSRDLTPEAAAATTPADLGLLLRRLLLREARERSDTPWTYRELAAKTGWSLGSISRYLDGKVVPPTDRFDALVRLLGAADAEQGALATARDRVAENQRRPAAATPAAAPRQLPREATWFTGRGTELDRLLAAAPQASAVVISAIDGMAGIGKTALAVHAAHRLAGRFPDGQVFLDLHGFTSGVARVEPDDALDRLLRDIGVPGERIPATLDERAALWRSLLAGRQMLLVLDNAATEAQVQPLLPGAAGCLVLVTSRRRLTALDATSVLSLDTLPEADAAELFVHTADRPGLTIGDPEVLEVVRLCGRLPLALRIAAARLRHRRVWTVVDLVERLRDLDARLAALDDGQRSVHAALQLSYQHLTDGVRRLYRLAGLHPGPDIEPYAAAALMGIGPDDARRMLDGLVDDHLLQEPTPGRYRFHDLVRAHAAGTAAREETQAQRRAAVGRLLDHYRHTVASAMDAAHPHEGRRRPPVAPAATPTPDVAQRERADRWLDAELANLIAAGQHAARHGWPEHTWQLSAGLDRHLRTRGRHQDAQTLHQQALDVARQHGNRSAEMAALNGLGSIHRIQGRPEQAGEHFERALRIARELGDRTGELFARQGLGHVHRRLGRHERAAGDFERALRIAHELDDPVGRRQASTGLGDVHRMLGRYESAAEHYGLALRIAQEIGDRVGELQALTGLGAIHKMLGRYEPAAGHYGRALQITREIGDHVGELQALTGIGNVDRMLGRYEQAVGHLRQALQMARSAGHRSGELQALRGLGEIHRLQGRHGEAAHCFERVLDLARTLGSGNWQFEALQGLGRLCVATGDPDQALVHHERALQLATELAQPIDQARAHDGLAHAYRATGRPGEARRHFQHALDILTRHGNDHTEDVEANAAAIRDHLTTLD